MSQYLVHYSMSPEVCVCGCLTMRGRRTRLPGDVRYATARLFSFPCVIHDLGMVFCFFSFRILRVDVGRTYSEARVKNGCSGCTVVQGLKC